VMKSYTAKYTKISSGYMGQLIEWPEVITEGKTIEECREMLRDALREMMQAYKQQGYERLAPGVLDELRRITPKGVKGRRKHRYHQRLTSDIGHPALREHIASVITLMKVSNNWRKFYAMLNRALPKWGSTLPMVLEFKEEEEANDRE